MVFAVTHTGTYIHTTHDAHVFGRGFSHSFKVSTFSLASNCITELKIVLVLKFIRSGINKEAHTRGCYTGKKLFIRTFSQ